MATVWFVDTSVLCNLLPVPGFDQDRDRVKKQMTIRQKARHSMVLPLTAVVETGNHISHLPSGTTRRSAAETFSNVLRLVATGGAPWQLHAFGWDSDFLTSLVEGAATGRSLVEHAEAKLGCGDLCILTEREVYRRRTGLTDVRLWTLDHQLAAHN